MQPVLRGRSRRHRRGCSGGVARRVAPVACAGLLGAAGLVLANGGTAAAATPPSCTTGTTVTCTYSYTGTSQAFTVPAGVAQVTVTAYGAQGGAASDGTPGGLGGEAVATIAVTAGSTLYVNVGNQPAGGRAAFNGGGAGGTGVGVFLFPEYGGGGGGASDVRVHGATLADRVVVAGGGGGGGGTDVTQTPPTPSCVGAAGGGTDGGTASCGEAATPPTGGTQTAWGEGGSGAFATGGDGTFGDGGTGETPPSSTQVLYIEGGGGGRGGWYGGGGGEAFDPIGFGGAGGSGRVPSGGTLTGGVRRGNGEVLIAYQAPAVSPTSTATTAADATATASAAAQDVTLEATVTSATGTVGSGTVDFTVLEGATPVGSPTAGSVSGGSASVSYQLPAGTLPGTYTIVAAYADPGGTFAPSSDDTHTLTVGAIATTTTVTATPAGPVAGQPVVLTATVDPTTAPTAGAVGFSAGGTAVPGCAAVPVSLGAATCTTSFATAGTVAVGATYADPGGLFGSSSSQVALGVAPAPPPPPGQASSSSTSPPSSQASSSNPSPVQPSEPAALAYTGSDAARPVTAGMLLAVCGGLLLAFDRRAAARRARRRS